MKAKKFLALLLSAVFVVSCMTFAIPVSAVTETGNVYEVPTIATPITADGVNDTSSEWKNALAIDVSGTDKYWAMANDSAFANRYGEGSTIYMMWDATNLYVGFDIKDPTISASITSDSGDATDCVELRFAANAAAGEGDLGGGTFTACPYYSNLDKAAVKFGNDVVADIVAASNQTSERTAEWTMECVIPFSTISAYLTKAGEAVAAGDNTYIQYRFRENTGGLGIMASQKDQGPFGGAKDTFIFSSKAAGDVSGNPFPVITGTETFKIPYAETAPTIDGKIDTAEWEGAEWVDLTQTGINWLMPADGNDIGASYGLMMWDETNIYLAFDIRDTTATTYQDNDSNDGVEFLMYSSADDTSSFYAAMYPNAGGQKKIKFNGNEENGGTMEAKLYDSNYVIEASIPWAETSKAPAALVSGANAFIDIRVRNFAADESTGNSDKQLGYGFSAGSKWSGNQKDTYTLTKPISENPYPAIMGEETFKIPYVGVAKPKIDGMINEAEWAGAEWINLSDAGLDGVLMKQDDFSVGNAYGLLKWDENYLYVAFDIRDTTDSVRYSSGIYNTNTDGVDLYTFAAGHTNEKTFWLPAKQSDTKSTQLFNAAKAVCGNAAATSYGANYVIEAAIPWSEYENLQNATAEGAPQNGSTLDIDFRIRNWNSERLLGWGLSGTGGWPNGYDTYTLVGKPLPANDPVAASDNDNAHKFYIPERTSEITIDGYLADDEWKNAERVSLKYEHVGWLMGADGYTDFGDSYVLMQWDSEYLYLGYNIEDKTSAPITANVTDYGDKVELSLFPSNAEGADEYARFTMAQLTDGSEHVVETHNILSADFDTGAKKATINYGSEYVTEVAIPWTTIEAAKNALIEKGFDCTYAPVAGTSLFMSVVIYDWNGATDGWACGWGFSAADENGSIGNLKKRDEFVLLGAPSLSVEDKEVKAGEEFTVDVTLANNPGIVALRYKVEFDADKLEFVRVADGGILKGFMDLSTDLTSPYIIGWEDALADNNNEENGVTATLTFKAKADVESGTTEIKITPVEAWATVNDFEGKEVTFVGGTATVTLKEAAHVHTMIKHDRVEPTCTVPGNIEYYECTGCGKLFADEAGETEITIEDTVLAIVPHTLTKHDRVEPTCTAPGNIEYYECSVCGKLFSDAEATTEITAEDTVLGKVDHKYETKFDDTHHWTECSVCHETTEKVEHTYGEWVITTAPELGVKGEKKHECACGHSETAEIAALGDIDGDGVVTEADAVLIARYLVGWKDVTVDIATADVDGDGRITDWDSILIKRFLDGWF